jgi:hypothetical protein
VSFFKKEAFIKRRLEMKRVLSLSVVLVALFVGLGAQAQDTEANPADTGSRELKKGGLFFEPGLTYEFSNAKTHWADNAANQVGSDANVEGLGISARIGGHISEIIFLGGDFRYSRPTYKDKVANLINYSQPANQWNYGVTAGAQMPWYGLRAWGTYVLGATLDPDAQGAADVAYKNGSGYRLGVGIKFEMVSLNLEYQNINYTNTTYGITNVANVDTTQNMGNRSWIVGVSFPLAF